MRYAKRYSQLLGEKAAELGIDEPCQELFDAFRLDGTGSGRDRRWRLRMARAVDAAAGTGSVGPDGLLYNEPPLPTRQRLVLGA